MPSGWRWSSSGRKILDRWRWTTNSSLLVRDYDEAIAFFTGALRFRLVEDTPLGDGKRWGSCGPGRVKRSFPSACEGIHP